ncbi:hypothetical protein [Yoonia sp. 208BN28-4]|uniref:hypothetical protein n=1 Tax=Yoonia sp. 208BN28-4 TaxID=3126505 RepID=UPI0030AA4B30
MSLICAMFPLLAACSGPPDAVRGYESPHIIENNRGGYLNDAIAERRRLAAWGGAVEIRGVCNSACVMFTTLPNACLSPDLQLGFHRSSSPIGAFVGNAQLSQFFRGGVKRMFDDVWSKLPDGEFATISAQEYVQLDPQSRICGS